jgi:hypothetical protein
MIAKEEQVAALSNGRLACVPRQLLYMSLHAASRASNHAHRLRFIQAVDTAQEDK